MAKDIREAIKEGTDYFSPENEQKRAKEKEQLEKEKKRILEEKRQREELKKQQKEESKKREIQRQLNLAENMLPKNCLGGIILLIAWLRKNTKLPGNYRTGCCFCGRVLNDTWLKQIFKNNLEKLGIKQQKNLFSTRNLLDILWLYFHDEAKAYPPRICNECLGLLIRK